MSRNFELEMLEYTVNSWARLMSESAEWYRSEAGEMLTESAKIRFEGIARGIEVAIRVAASMMPISEEYVPSEAPATSVA